MSLEGEIEWIKKINREKKEEIWSIYAKENNKLIGNVGVHALDNPDRFYIVGIIIGEKNYWGKGYGYDAFQTIVKYAFEKKKANQLVLDVCTENKTALRIYEKCSFKITRTFRKFWEREGKEYDCYEMKLPNPLCFPENPAA